MAASDEEIARLERELAALEDEKRRLDREFADVGAPGFPEGSENEEPPSADCNRPQILQRLLTKSGFDYA